MKPLLSPLFGATGCRRHIHVTDTPRRHHTQIQDAAETTFNAAATRQRHARRCHRHATRIDALRRQQHISRASRVIYCHAVPPATTEFQNRTTGHVIIAGHWRHRLYVPRHVIEETPSVHGSQPAEAAATHGVPAEGLRRPHRWRRASRHLILKMPSQH